MISLCCCSYTSGVSSGYLVDAATAVTISADNQAILSLAVERYALSPPDMPLAFVNSLGSPVCCCRLMG